MDLQDSLFGNSAGTLSPGGLAEVRGAVWRVRRVRGGGAHQEVDCVGISGICRGKEATFVRGLEPGLRALDPAGIGLINDASPGYRDSQLFLEAALRGTPPVSQEPQVLGRAPIDDLPFQHVPVRRLLLQARPRLLVADDVGLGKTLEAGLITAELILRQRASRILVVTTRAMLAQIQKEFWTRFSVPLARLDGPAIRRMRDRIPAHYNVFERFDRAIVSIDTLKRDLQYRDALEATRWDLVIIDEAHNAADRSANSGSRAARSELAERLSRTADALILLTATPHDGSQSSFASLVKMLDPTRVPNAEDLRREDIDDLVVRRFRSTPEVQEAMQGAVKKRTLIERRFPLTAAEDEAYRLVAELKLDLDDEVGRRRGIDLFRTSVAKALFSSPAACNETVRGRIRRIEAGTAKGSERDLATLRELAAHVEAIGDDGFSKYRELLAALRESGWTGRDRRDRLVIFSERIPTLSWLEARLASDLTLPADAVGRVDGTTIDVDENAQKLLEDFGQEGAPIRVLLASDLASEGLNLHFQCHRLIHFDLPWSLLRFQQRNGRIDRYGQENTPEITYFVGESSHERVRDMWVLDKLVEKDEAAQKGVGDPAVFLGVGDPEREEAVTAEAVAGAIGGDAFARQMDERAAEAAAAAATDDSWDLLFGEYEGPPASVAAAPVNPTPATARLFPDTFAYAAAMLQRLAQPSGRSGPVLEPPTIIPAQRLIRFDLPEELKAVDDFGYARSGQVDEAYMPVEALGAGDRVELTDDRRAIDNAIRQARGDERAWPQVQFLWDVHPLIGWLNDRAETLFPRFTAPVVRLGGRLPDGENAVVLRGAVLNRVGRPVVVTWGVVRGRTTGGRRVECGAVEDLGAFLAKVGFAGEVTNRGDADPDAAKPLLRPAVEAFQRHLVGLRTEKAAELVEGQKATLARLAAFEARFDEQLAFEFGDIDESAVTIAARSRRSRRDERRAEVKRMFEDWRRWFEDTCELDEDPNPFVEVKAVFQG